MQLHSGDVLQASAKSWAWRPGDEVMCEVVSQNTAGKVNCVANFSTCNFNDPIGVHKYVTLTSEIQDGIYRHLISTSPFQIYKIVMK